MQCVANALFLSLEQVFGRIKSLSVYRSTSMLAGKFFARPFCAPTGSCFSIAATMNHRGSAHLQGIQYRVSRKCTGEVIIVGSHFSRSYPT